MEIVPFKVEHVAQIKLQPFQSLTLSFVDMESLKVFEGTDCAYTAIDNGEVLAIGGVLDFCDGRGYGWSFLGGNIGHRMISVTRAIKRFLEVCRFRRIEIAVDCNYETAHVWAKMLGFTKECDRMRSFTPDGRDCALYAKVKS